MGQPTKVIVKRYTIRDGNELILVPERDAQIAHEIKLQELREADKFIPKPQATTSSPLTAQEVRQQAPPRAQSREITAPWEFQKPQTCEFNRKGTCVPVIFQSEGEQISERTRRKAFISAVRDQTWEMEGERALGLPAMISPEIKTAVPGQIIPYRTRFLPENETPKLTRGVLHVTPRIPLSFPIGITVVFNEEVAKITITERWTLPILEPARSHLNLYMRYSCAPSPHVPTCPPHLDSSSPIIDYGDNGAARSRDLASVPTYPLVGAGSLGRTRVNVLLLILDRRARTLRKRARWSVCRVS
jgi:hypothetical protein